ncbi:flagellar brake protein [Amphibacillus cookii]|uniref:flagellar brake protein n=1 Tax=Amphibacillus cookii TaxID=767787 RepID=UPI00195E651E|nr:flagellar brake domain-containing protein [Amphibacillus cookii]MBM7542501.1 c-di-GMP-binding flagellar brake protein YcgR [Amphibacillus cookii]
MKIGTQLILEQEQQDSSIRRYRCRIVELKGLKCYIDQPINIETGRTQAIPVGSCFSGYFVDKDEAIYTFTTEVMERKKDNIPMLILAFDQSKMKKVQRREYVRVPVNLDISILNLNNPLKPLVTVTKDISGGGVAVVLPPDHFYEPGVSLELILVLSSGDRQIDYIVTEAETIRIESSNDKQVLSMKFVTINENDRQRIIQFCFDRQLKQRRQQMNI